MPEKCCIDFNKINRAGRVLIFLVQGPAQEVQHCMESPAGSAPSRKRPVTVSGEPKKFFMQVIDVSKNRSINTENLLKEIEIIMKKIIFLFLVIFFASVENCFAWGPMTHTHFAFEILRAASLLPAAVYALLTAYSTNFIYGSLVPDLFLGRPGQKNPHDWETGFLLLQGSRNRADRAFALGFLSHLAADTVAHGQMNLGSKSKLGHAWVEMESDALVTSKCWQTVSSLDKDRLVSNDHLTGQIINPRDCRSRSFQSMYRMYLRLSVLNRWRLTCFYPEDFTRYHKMSVQRAIDVISRKDASTYVSQTPNIRKNNRIKVALKSILT